MGRAPPELLGSWQATISTGEEVTLELRPSGYTVNRAGAAGSGSIEVEGDHIVFASARCELGSGEYRWSIDGETLTFTPLEPRDPCGKPDHLPGGRRLHPGGVTGLGQRTLERV